VGCRRDSAFLTRLLITQTSQRDVLTRKKDRWLGGGIFLDDGSYGVRSTMAGIGQDVKGERSLGNLDGEKLLLANHGVSVRNVFRKGDGRQRGTKIVRK